MTSIDSIKQTLSNLGEKDLLEVLHHIQKNIYIPCIISRVQFEHIVKRQVTDDEFKDVINNISTTTKINNMVEYSLEMSYSETDFDKN